MKNCLWFKQVFSRNRFELIKCLHACEVDATGKAKIEPFVERLVVNFQNTFYPFKNIWIDEMVIGFKGRFSMRQYNPQKPSKHHIKTFGLCDSATGYCYNLFVYLGADTTWHPRHDPGAQQAEKVFQKPTQPLRTQKHHIFADRLYTSIPVITFITRAGISYTGTINVNRRSFLLAIKQTKLRYILFVFSIK